MEQGAAPLGTLRGTKQLIVIRDPKEYHVGKFHAKNETDEIDFRALSRMFAEKVPEDTQSKGIPANLLQPVHPNRRGERRRQLEKWFEKNKERRTVKTRVKKYHIEDIEGEQAYEGSLEGGQSSKYVLFVLEDNNPIVKVVPVSNWYNFKYKTHYKTLSLEEAEATLSTRTAKLDRWMMHKFSKKEEKPEEKESAGLVPDLEEEDDFAAFGGGSDNEKDKKKKGQAIKREAEDAVEEGGGGGGGGGGEEEEMRVGEDEKEEPDFDFDRNDDDDESLVLDEEEDTETKKTAADDDDNIEKRLTASGKDMKKLLKTVGKEEEPPSSEEEEDEEEEEGEEEETKEGSPKTEPTSEASASKPEESKSLKRPAPSSTTTHQEKKIKIEEASPGTDEPITEDEVKKALLLSGKIKTKQFVKRFKSRILDKSKKAAFSKIVKKLGRIVDEHGEKYLVLKDEYRGGLKLPKL